METDLGDAIWRMETGYCLWVGAGLTRQVAGGKAAVPLWDDVTKELESAAGIKPSKKRDFPKRLDACFAQLGDKPFRTYLRERYYTRLCEAILSQANQLVDTDDYIPRDVRAVASLGQIANPIVSFNIEPLSSLLVGRAAGPVRIMFQQPPGQPTFTWREPGGHFQRLVYHPHGLATSETVMTKAQYKANRQTLAFGLAIHAAYGNTLAIVGMSLDDEYLRKHLERFRGGIGPIFWFNSDFPDDLSAWAERNDITCVRAPWAEFWQRWHEIPIELDQNQLAIAWYMAVNEATEEAEGGAQGSLERSLAASPAAASSESFRNLAARMAAAGASAGEPGKSVLIDGKKPRKIELALRERLSGDKIQPPSISKSYGPRVSLTES
jgi:hypothetical protein